MDDIPNINPVKPLWPRRPDEKSQQPRRQQQDDEDRREEDSTGDEHPRSDHDGQIDEYV